MKSGWFRPVALLVFLHTASVIGCPIEAAAGPNRNAKVMVNLPNADLNICSQNYLSACQFQKTAGSLVPRTYYAFLTVTDGDAAAGVGGVRCGIDYDNAVFSGVDIFSWNGPCVFNATWLMTDGPNGPWPAGGSGIEIRWDDGVVPCQRREPGGLGTGVGVHVGYFYCGAYTPDRLSIVPHPDGTVVVYSCAGAPDTIQGGGISHSPSHLGYAQFSQSGTEPGYNPCGMITPVQETAWGSVKWLFRGR